MKIVACSIFRKELEAVAPDLACDATWLPAGLHADLDRLHERLEEEAVREEDRVACLYGACHPGIDELLASRGGRRLPGKDCVGVFVDEETRQELEGRRAFVMTPGWLHNWREIFEQGCGWDSIDARQNFGFYDTVILLDFGLEPIDDLEVLEFFEYTQTPVEVVPADLDRFRNVLRKVIDGAAES